MASADAVYITQLFTALLPHMTSQSNSLQEQIMRNDLKLSTDFQKAVQANDDFKKNVRAELDNLCCLLTQQQTVSSPSPNNIILDPVISSASIPVILDSTSIFPSLSSTASSTT